MIKDVPSGKKRGIGFLLEKINQDQNDEGRAIGYRIRNWVFAVQKKILMKMMKDVPSGTKKKIEFLLGKKIQDQNDEGRAIGYEK